MLIGTARTIGICAAYVILRLFVARFFNLTHSTEIDVRAYRSVLLIVIVCILGYVLGAYVPDPWWANRAEHAVGGGVAVTLACFCAARETAPSLDTLRFIVIATFMVATLGVANECVEFVLGISDLNPAFDPYDTEWDLISNTVGMIFGICLLAPFTRKTQAEGKWIDNKIGEL